MNKTTDSYSSGSSNSALSMTSGGLFLLFLVTALALSYEPLMGLGSTGQSSYYSHLVLIPFVSAYFLFTERKRIFAQTGHSWKLGTGIVVMGFLVYLTAVWQSEWLGPNDYASLATLGAVFVVWGGFVIAFGTASFGRARFSLLFLILVVPIPLFLLDGLISLLQAASTEVTQWLFDLTGTAYFRDGFVFQLSNITIEVAKECSGIRSTIALIITGILAGYLFLDSWWQTAVLLITIFPITVLKNAIRILTLSLLAIHVDTRFITDSFLHHSGGFLFYIPALFFMWLVIWTMRRGRKA
jgi:exosortase